MTDTSSTGPAPAPGAPNDPPAPSDPAALTETPPAEVEPTAPARSDLAVGDRVVYAYDSPYDGPQEAHGLVWELLPDGGDGPRAVVAWVTLSGPIHLDDLAAPKATPPPET